MLLIMKNFHGLKENLACERESDEFSHCLFDMQELGCLLPPFQLLGFIWHQMSLELVQSTGWVSLSTMPKGTARFVKQEF